MPHSVVVASDAQFTRRSKAGPLREVPQRFGWPCWKRMKRQSDFGVLSASLSIGALGQRSEEHTSELQSLMRISYAVFCLKKKKHDQRCRTKQWYDNIWTMNTH